MKIHIDKNGILFLERKNKMKKQYCPYTERYCSDNCPHFNILNFQEDPPPPFRQG